MSASKSKSGFEPRVYTKGDAVKVANSASESVALEFDGFVVQKDAAAPDESANSGTTVSETAAVPDTASDTSTPAAKKAAAPKPPKDTNA